MCQSTGPWLCCVCLCVWYQIRVPAKKHIMCQTSVNLMPCCIKESFHVNLKNSKGHPSWPPQTLVIFGYYVHLYKMRKSWKFQVNILSGLEVMLFEGGKLRGTWLRGLPNLKFPSISRVNDLFSNLDRALTFSKSKELQKMHKKYSKWVFQNFQKIHNGGLKIEKTPKIQIWDHFREPITSKSHQLTYWNLKIW